MGTIGLTRITDGQQYFAEMHFHSVMEACMSQANKMSGVSECTISWCAYNSERTCHAIALTIGDGLRSGRDRIFDPSMYTEPPATDAVAHRISAYCYNLDFEPDAAVIRGGCGENYRKNVTFFAA